MTEEKILEQAFGIKNGMLVHTEEEHQIITRADSIINQRTGVVESLEKRVEKLSNTILRDINDPKNWQPYSHLPDFSAEWIDEINRIQNQSKSLPAELLVVLVGNMITEEALPTYQTLLNRITATKDLTGNYDSAWGRWTRGWTAEEYRHGVLLHTYLMFMPRLNMPAVERDIQHLIGRGFNPQTGEDPYKLMVYTSFQEKATFISHLGTAKIAKEHGDEKLYTICSSIAKDEGRHFNFYKGVMKEIFAADQEGAMTAYSHMMKKTISMPAEELDNSRNPTLFTDFSDVAQAIGVYTARDYVDILEQLNTEWDIRGRKVTSDEAKKAQEYLLKLPERYLKLANRRERKKFKFDTSRFDWIK